MKNSRIESFTYNGATLAVVFQESYEVVPGVTCDVYIHPETQQRDLGIITIEPHAKTPRQKVLGGDETIEGYLSGKGTLTITHRDGKQSVFEVGPENEGFSHPVEIGEIMQWQADDNEGLIVFEICFPPYQDGRFENLI